MKVPKLTIYRRAGGRSTLIRVPSAVGLLVFVLAATHLYATKYAGDFEELNVSARAIGMGGAFVAVGADPAALYYNPSATLLLDRRHVFLMHAENFGGIVKNDFASLLLPAERHALGVGLLHNGIAGINLTELRNPRLPVGTEYEDTTVLVRDTVVNGHQYHAGDTLIETRLNVPYVTRTVSAADWVFYLNYARKISEHLLLGGNGKLIYRTTGVANCFGMGVDIGATVIPVRDLNVALRIRNLTSTPLLWDTKTREAINPRPVIGLGKSFNLSENHRLLISIEAEGNFEGLPIEQNIGTEYEFRKLFSCRLGFYRGNFTFGLGAAYKALFVDYGYQTAAYSKARELPATQKFAAGLRF